MCEPRHLPGVGRRCATVSCVCCLDTSVSRANTALKALARVSIVLVRSFSLSSTSSASSVFVDDSSSARWRYRVNSMASSSDGGFWAGRTSSDEVVAVALFTLGDATKDSKQRLRSAATSSPATPDSCSLSLSQSTLRKGSKTLLSVSTTS